MNSYEVSQSELEEEERLLDFLCFFLSFFAFFFAFFASFFAFLSA